MGELAKSLGVQILYTVKWFAKEQLEVLFFYFPQGYIILLYILAFFCLTGEKKTQKNKTLKFLLTGNMLPHPLQQTYKITLVFLKKCGKSFMSTWYIFCSASRSPNAWPLQMWHHLKGTWADFQMFELFCQKTLWQQKNYLPNTKFLTSSDEFSYPKTFNVTSCNSVFVHLFEGESNTCNPFVSFFFLCFLFYSYIIVLFVELKLLTVKFEKVPFFPN